MNQLELRDIHLPDVSLWWPPAPGWWILALLLLGAAIALPLLLRQMRRNALRRASLRALAQIQRDYAAEADPAKTLRDLGGLLRRTVISYRGRADYASSTGDAWAAQLRDLAGRGAFDDAQLRLLSRERYRRHCDYEIEPLLEASRQWMRALPRSRADAAD